MLSGFSRLLIGVSALSPLLLILGVLEYVFYGWTWFSIQLIVLSICLIVCFWSILKFARLKMPTSFIFPSWISKSGRSWHPLYLLSGYRKYSFRMQGNSPKILLSKRDIVGHKAKNKIRVKQLTKNIFLDNQD